MWEMFLAADWWPLSVSEEIKYTVMDPTRFRSVISGYAIKQTFFSSSHTLSPHWPFWHLKPLKRPNCFVRGVVFRDDTSKTRVDSSETRIRRRHSVRLLIAPLHLSKLARPKTYNTRVTIKLDFGSRKFMKFFETNHVTRRGTIYKMKTRLMFYKKNEETRFFFSLHSSLIFSF